MYHSREEEFVNMMNPRDKTGLSEFTFMVHSSSSVGCMYPVHVHVHLTLLLRFLLIFSLDFCNVQRFTKMIKHLNLNSQTRGSHKSRSHPRKLSRANADEGENLGHTLSRA